MGKRTEWGTETCGYCGLTALGTAAYYGRRLCHDEKRDCYQVVTVWGGDWAAYARTAEFARQTAWTEKATVSPASGHDLF